MQTATSYWKFKTKVLECMLEHFQVIRQVGSKVACARCDKIVQAEAPSRPITCCLAGPGLLAPAANSLKMEDNSGSGLDPVFVGQDS